MVITGVLYGPGTLGIDLFEHRSEGPFYHEYYSSGPWICDSSPIVKQYINQTPYNFNYTETLQRFIPLTHPSMHVPDTVSFIRINFGTHTYFDGSLFRLLFYSSLGFVTQNSLTKLTVPSPPLWSPPCLFVGNLIKRGLRSFVLIKFIFLHQSSIIVTSSDDFYK